MLLGAAAACLAAGCLDAVHWSGDRFGDTTSYFRSRDLIEEAGALLERAREAGAAEFAPYPVARATESLARARAKHAQGDYPAAEVLAAQARDAASEALRVHAERTGAPEPAPASEGGS